MCDKLQCAEYNLVICISAQESWDYIGFTRMALDMKNRKLWVCSVMLTCIVLLHPILCVFGDVDMHCVAASNSLCVPPAGFA